MQTTITICCSAAFFKQALEYKQKLEKMGFKVLVPHVAEEMQRSGNFDVASYKTWWTNEADYSKKADLIVKHFAKVAEGDAILVLNFDKKGVKGYIGGNTLMEMAVAFYLKKMIYVLNPIADDLSTKEEVYGMLPVFLRGDLRLIR